MGKRGPAKYPAVIHKAHGNYRKDQHGGPDLPVETPKMPPGMDKDAQSVWRELTPLLEMAGLVSQVDQFALRLLCESAAMYYKAVKDINKRGITIEATNNKGYTNEVRNPYLAVRDTTWAQIYRLCREFGLTPSSRTGLKAIGENRPSSVMDILGIALDN